MESKYVQCERCNDHKAAVGHKLCICCLGELEKFYRDWVETHPLTLQNIARYKKLKKEGEDTMIRTKHNKMLRKKANWECRKELAYRQANEILLDILCEGETIDACGNLLSSWKRSSLFPFEKIEGK